MMVTDCKLPTCIVAVPDILFALTEHRHTNEEPGGHRQTHFYT